MRVVAMASRKGGQKGGSGKAAFTLRLDAERHLRPRLAGAVSYQPAQAFVVRALDTFLTTLSTMPGVEALVARPPAERTI